MTNEEFDKIISIQKEINCLETILYGYFGNSKNPTIYNLQISYLNNCERDKIISISKELSNDILKLVTKKLKELKNKFETFKTE